jgi:hypothetical protein
MTVQLLKTSPEVTDPDSAARRVLLSAMANFAHLTAKLGTIPGHLSYTATLVSLVLPISLVVFLVKIWI